VNYRRHIEEWRYIATLSQHQHWNKVTGQLPAPVALLLEKEPVTLSMVGWTNFSTSPDDLE
jgi:hypothetical protein